MAPKIDDRWLWLGFGVFLFFATKGLRYALQDVTRLTEITPSHFQAETKDHGEQPEDNLRILAESPDSNIANAAISLIISRFDALPGSRRALAKDLSSEDEETREKAKNAIEFLRTWGSNVRSLPGSSPRIPDSPPDSPSPVEVRLTTSELARRLSEAPGGVAGGDGSGDAVVPSLLNPVAGWTNVPRERPIGEDPEEVERRRRRREAMVLHEGSGAVREDDIFRPLRQELGI